MRWTVTAPPGAENELSDIWLNAADRQEVASAADTIERGLRRNPLGWGTDQGTHREWTVGPLTVTYTVSPDDLMVRILHYASP